ncbi:hypothetical protein [Dactylosporangium darangshiense]|uniref:hypothetical protein n=1 Tax=Dactylosporangium darangshiense TaxID=579108 RepID=UPI003642C83D
MSRAKSLRHSSVGTGGRGVSTSTSGWATGTSGSLERSRSRSAVIQLAIMWKAIA